MLHSKSIDFKKSPTTTACFAAMSIKEFARVYVMSAAIVAPIEKFLAFSIKRNAQISTQIYAGEESR
ncbi:MAG TPA: hypothetical protein DHV53_00130 [Gammaproteobacteria bacterium]|nr:hypothetical protein [Gammaproteobacteria bacterium]HCA36662.1 hypothetical protein [Gammaproteobacteria bacterium]HCI87030.1 hypothetical protein [Gammaproteobacteria bacterium]|tara:strand:- start:275 stop:475 length:201 start_codon:yes stop_codon:yes gene_type:complete